MDNVNFSELITLLRKREMLTQKQLSAILGVTTSAVSKWENGKNFPDSATVARICEYFKITPNELFNPAETIKQLQNGTFERTVETVPEAEPAKKKWYHKKLLLPVLGLLLLMAIVITVCIVKHTNKSEAPNCSLYSVRVCIDDVHKDTVYEMAYLCSDILNYDAKDPFIQAIYTGWLSDPNVSQDIDTLKISFYNDEVAASEWLDPYCSIYLYREE